ncbi:MAG: flagellar hook-basal body complex protein, partial [Selenomonadaceae bacterium]|nr:flagellar hook-basal body complex protein [Selenomonadaceae bacterium]
MWRGLYTAATGMISEQKRTDVIASNLANAATTGYKRDVTVHREFHQMLIKRINDHENAGSLGMDVAPFNSLADLGTSKEDVTQIKGFSADPFYRPGIGPLGLGDYIDEVAVDYQQGAIESTGNTFDLAVVGDGFFAVQTPEGVRYTRNGAFFKSTRAFCKTFAATICWTRRATRFAFPPMFATRKSQSRATAP